MPVDGQLSGRDVWHHPVHRGPCCSSWSGTLAVIHTGPSVIVSLNDGMMLACSFVRDERKRQYEDKQDWQPSQAESSTARLLDFDGASRVACKKKFITTSPSNCHAIIGRSLIRNCFALQTQRNTAYFLV